MFIFVNKLDSLNNFQYYESFLIFSRTFELFQLSVDFCIIDIFNKH